MVQGKQRMSKRVYLVWWQEWWDEHLTDRVATVEAEDNPKAIARALREYGLSWQLNGHDMAIYEVANRWSGPMLLSEAELKISKDYKLIDIDETEPPEEPLEIDLKSFIAISGDFALVTKPQEEKVK